jgi:hypothetical protein
MNRSKMIRTNLIKWETMINQMVIIKIKNATTIPSRIITKTLLITSTLNIEVEGGQKVQRIKKL